MEATDAALAAARRLGLGVREAVEVHVGTHVLVRLEPGPVAARVTAHDTLLAGDLDTEVWLAAALHARGAPVLPPLAGVPPEAHAVADRRVTLWTWWDRVGEDTPEAIGRALADCHRALPGVEVALRPWASLAQARARLDELEPAHRALLAPCLELSDEGPLRPVHGDAHAGNVLPGPVWHDWEDAQLGWTEWDLGCLVAPGRVLGTDFGYGEAILAGYAEPYDEERLTRCVAARTAYQAVGGLLLVDLVPGIAERVRARLDWLAEQR